MRPLLIQVSGPATGPISVDDVKLNSKVDYTDEDHVLADMVAGAIERLDGPNGLLGRALITQSWKAIYPRFPFEISVPLGRTQSVDSITYLDASGATQTLDPSAYRVTGLLTDDARIRPVAGTSWPSVQTDREAVTVTFTAGFGDAAGDVPASIRRALVELAADSYENREAAAMLDRGAKFYEVPTSAFAAVADWKLYPAEPHDDRDWHPVRWWI